MTCWWSEVERLGFVSSVKETKEEVFSILLLLVWCDLLYSESQAGSDGNVFEDLRVFSSNTPTHNHASLSTNNHNYNLVFFLTSGHFYIIYVTRL